MEDLNPSRPADPPGDSAGQSDAVKGKATRRRKREEQLIACLAVGLQYPECARICKVSVRTIKTRMADRAYRAIVRRESREIFHQAGREIVDAVSESIKVLREKLGSSLDNVGVSAARSILEYACRIHDVTTAHEELEEAKRLLEELENRAEGGQQPGHYTSEELLTRNLIYGLPNPEPEGPGWDRDRKGELPNEASEYDKGFADGMAAAAKTNGTE